VNFLFYIKILINIKSFHLFYETVKKYPNTFNLSYSQNLFHLFYEIANSAHKNPTSFFIFSLKTPTIFTDYIN